MNIQIAATLGGRLAAMSPIPAHGARHDAHTIDASRPEHIGPRSQG